MYEMTEEEKDARQIIKTLHKRVREDMYEAARQSGHGHRYMLLVWAFIRGLKFRRVERTHHMQGFYEHNMPAAVLLTNCLKKYLGQDEDLRKKVEAWLADPSGAIAAPPPRLKKPYVATVAKTG
jgi:hypothetical protein